MNIRDYGVIVFNSMLRKSANGMNVRPKKNYDLPFGSLWGPAALGGGVGVLASPDKEDKLESGVRGAGVGALTGLGANVGNHLGSWLSRLLIGSSNKIDGDKTLSDITEGVGTLGGTLLGAGGGFAGGKHLLWDSKYGKPDMTKEKANVKKKTKKWYDDKYPGKREYQEDKSKAKKKYKEKKKAPKTEKKSSLVGNIAQGVMKAPTAPLAGAATGVANTAVGALGNTAKLYAQLRQLIDHNRAGGSFSPDIAGREWEKIPGERRVPGVGGIKLLPATRGLGAARTLPNMKPKLPKLM